MSQTSTPDNRLEWIRANTRESVIDIACGCSTYFWNDGKHIEEEINYLGLDMYEASELIRAKNKVLFEQDYP